MCLTAIVGLIEPFLACVDGLGMDRRELRNFHYLNANSGTLWPRLEFDQSQSELPSVGIAFPSIVRLAHHFGLRILGTGRRVLAPQKRNGSSS